MTTKTKHKIIKTDIRMPYNEERIWCSCGTRCNPGVTLTAMDTWKQHAGK